jgi:hypothetical protein
MALNQDKLWSLLPVVWKMAATAFGGAAASDPSLEEWSGDRENGMDAGRWTGTRSLSALMAVKEAVLRILAI